MQAASNRSFQNGLERLSISGVPWRVVTREGKVFCQAAMLCVPDRVARLLLTVIDRDPEAVMRARAD